ncbi:MAG: hypothetical protein IANPNBLG_03463 [Bryobacteraceae bacterium]|nr:hypothetical protein [Bryobacteraceae bacterium]
MFRSGNKPVTGARIRTAADVSGTSGLNIHRTFTRLLWISNRIALPGKRPGEVPFVEPQPAFHPYGLSG